jgi:hypothetical protein
MLSIKFNECYSNLGGDRVNSTFPTCKFAELELLIL